MAMNDALDWSADLGGGTRISLVQAGWFRSDAGVLCRVAASPAPEPAGARTPHPSDGPTAERRAPFAPPPADARAPVPAARHSSASATS